MADYLPSSDAEFDNWQKHFIKQAEADLGTNVAALYNQLNGQSWEFSKAYDTHLDMQDKAIAATAKKEETRASLTGLLRTAAQLAQSDPTVTDEQRAAAGLPIRKDGRTPVPAPTTRPVVEVDTSQRLEHKISFRDEGASGTARPKGTRGVEIYVKIGDTPPASENELHFLGLDSRSPYHAQFDFADAGKTAYYMLRWVSTRGETGPWSETVSATIGG